MTKVYRAWEMVSKICFTVCFFCLFTASCLAPFPVAAVGILALLMALHSGKMMKREKLRYWEMMNREGVDFQELFRGMRL